MPLTLGPKPTNSLRLLVFSDWRVQDLEHIRRCVDQRDDIDLIVYGGDDLDRIIARPDILSYITSKCSGGRFLFVAGNDDTPELRSKLSSLPGTHDLAKTPFFHRGFAFFGVDGSLGDRGTILRTEASIKRLLKKHHTAAAAKTYRRRPLTPVLVSHSPPFGILDHALRHSETAGGRSIGSISVEAFLNANTVPLTICGHVHLCGGQLHKLSNGNTVLNIASHDAGGDLGRLAYADIGRDGSTAVHIFTTVDLNEKDELAYLFQINDERAALLRTRGIGGLKDVTLENGHLLLSLPGSSKTLVDKLIRHAEMLRGEQRDLEIYDDKRLKFLASDHFVVWDVETDLDNSWHTKKIWLIGALDTRSGELRQFFNPNDERACVEEFLAWMEERRSAVPVSYSGSRFERKSLEMLGARYCLVSCAPIASRDYDLCIEIQQSCLHSYRTPWELKPLASAMGYSFRHPNLDGLQVGLAFSQYLQKKEEPNWKQFLEYNQDDVLSANHVLQRIRAKYLDGINRNARVGTTLSLF